MNTENLSIPEGYTLYEKLDTGYIIRKDNCRVFIPYDYNGDTATTIYRPGAGSLGDDYYYVKKGLNNGGDQIVVMLSGSSADDNNDKNYTYHEQDEQLYGIANEVQQSLGITNSGMTESGYSISYDASLKGAANYAIENPDAAPITINLIDGGRGADYGDPGLVHVADLTEEQLKALADNGATVNLFERSNEMDSETVNNAIEYLSKNGVDVHVYYGENNHAEQRNDAMEAGIFTSNPDYSGYKEVTYSASNITETTTNPGTSNSIPPVNNGTQNIDLSKYATQVGETATKYVIPAGEMGNDTGKTIELIIPNDKNGIYGMYGQIDGGGKETWSKMEDSLLNNNEGAIAVKLSPASSITSASGRAQTAEENMEILSYIGKITGQKEAQVIGASKGSLYALDVGAESASSPNKYGVTVTSVGWTDYANPENADFITALEKMKKGNVELIGITDTDISENSGTGKAITEYYKRGGTAGIYQYATGYSHNTKCYMGALAFMGIATGVNFSQYLEYENGEQIISPYDSSTIQITSSSSGEIVSVDYQFVRDNINSILLLINNSSITMSDTIGIATLGSATYQAANTIFNNYANTSIDFINSLGQTCGNILAMTESILELDGALAAVALNDINSINISSFNEFYDKLPNFDMLSNFKDEGGTLKITKDGLLAAMSDSNVILSALTNDIADTQKLKLQLDSFVQDSSNNLKGPAWDKMRSKVNEYSETCQKKINYANNLIESMKKAYQKLLDHMEEFDTLDMAQIGEIEQGISDMKAQISALESLIASTPDYEDIMGYDPKTGTYVVVGQISHVAEKESWRETIKICEEVKAVLEKNLQKLNELPSVDSSAAEEITSNTTNQPETPTAKPISKPTPTPNNSVSLDTNDIDNTKPNQTVNNESTNVNKDNNKESIDKQDGTKNDQIVEKNENNKNNTNTQDEKQTSTQNNQNTTTSSEQQPTINNQATTDNLNNNYDNNNSNIFKTFGIAGGIAGAAGAAAYGAKLYNEKKNENNYEQSKEKNNNRAEEDDDTGLDNFE